VRGSFPDAFEDAFTLAALLPEAAGAAEGVCPKEKVAATIAMVVSFVAREQNDRNFMDNLISI
jgi:hypothetical protein